jgi:hypothetical protein
MPQAVAAAAVWIGNAVAGAAAAAGVSASTAAAIAATVTAVSEIALYAGMQYAIDSISRPKQRPLGSELNLNLDPTYAREMIIGQRPVGGSLVARYSRGSNLYNAHFVIQLADHPCVELSKVYGDGRIVQDSPLSHGVRTEITAYSYSGGARVWMTWHDGRPGQTADADLITKSAQDPDVVAGKFPAWSSDHRGAGCAYVHVEVQWDSDILTSIPQFLFLVKGAKFYDRRLDTTAGGSGDHRLDDPATWGYTTNAMVALDHWMLGYEVEDDPLAFGLGLSPTEVLPYAQFEAQADLCDEDVETGTGGDVETIKRYAVNGVLSTAQFFEDVIEDFQIQMAARVVDLGGRIGILGAEERAITVSLTEDDLVSGEPLQFADKLPFNDLVGSVAGSFSDPANMWQPTPYTRQVSAFAALPDGGEAQAVTLDLPLEVHPRRAARLVSAWFSRESLQPRLVGVFMPKAWKLEAGDWFEFTSARLQLEAAKFEVVDIVKNDDFTVIITARAIDPDFLAFDNDNDPDLSVPPDVDPVSLILDEPEFDVDVTTLEAGGVIEPALEFTLTSDETVAREIVVEYGKWDGADIEGPTLVDSFHVSQIVTKLRKGVLPSTQYVVRAKAKAGRRESPWTAWSSPLTTGATYAVGSAASVPWSGVTDDGARPDDNADVTSANTAAAITGQGWGATASEAAASNALVPAGANGLVDTSFRFQSSYWTLDSVTGSVTPSVSVSTAGLRKSVATAAGMTVDGSGYVRQRSFAQKEQFPCKAGDNLAARVLLGGVNISSLSLRISFRDAAGSLLGSTTATSLSTGLLTGAGEETDFNELVNYGTAPANTATATIDCRGVASSAAPVLRIAKPLLARIAAGQTAVPLFSPGREHELAANVTETRTAAAITSQGALATLSALTQAIADASNLLRRTAGGLFTGELNADLTSAHTAAAIAAQGALATLSTINNSALMGAGVVLYTALSSTAVRLGTNITRADGSTSLTDSLVVTSLGTAAAFTGQGALATLSTINSSGLLDSGVVTYTALASTAVRLGTNITRADGSTSLTDSLAVTSLGTAAAIASQGSLATISRANIVSLAGSEVLNNALVPAGANGLVDTSFRFQSTYWSKDGESGATVFSVAVSTAGLRKSVVTGSGFTTGHYMRQHSFAQNGQFPCKAGDVVGARVLLGGDNVSALQLYIAFRDAAGTLLGVSTLATVTSGILPGTGEETDFNELTTVGTAPSGTVVATLDCRGIASSAAPVLRLAKPLMARLPAGQTVAPIYSPGREHELGANVTETRTAAAFTGQGALATLSTINSSGLLDAGVVNYTALSSTAVRLGTNITRADGSTSVTDALVVTSLGTASAITSQGALATLSQVNLGASGRVYRDDGSTHLTDTLAVTSLGTAAAFTGQGALATLSTINSSSLMGAGVVVHTALASTAVRLGTNITRNDGTTSLTDSLAVTSLGTAAAIASQGSLATVSRANIVALSGSENVNNALLDPQLYSLQSAAMPERVAIAEDFTASFSANGTPATFAPLAVGSVTQVANEGDVRSFSSLTTVATRGWLPVVSDRTYRITVRSKVTVDGTDNRIYTAFIAHTADGTFLAAIDFNAAENPHEIADGWKTHTRNITGAAILAAQSTAAFVRARVSVNRNGSSTDSGAETDVSILKLERLQRLADGSLVREDGATTLTDATVITSAGTAAAITSQGGLATLSFVQLNSNVRLQNGTTVATDAMVVTSSGTAAGISGQGGLATVNFVQLNSTVRLQDGTTVITDVMVVTSSGTAAGITGQGALATVSTVVTSHLGANAVTAGTVDEDDSQQLFDQTWTAVADVTVTTPDANTLIYLPFSAYIESVGFDATIGQARIKRDSTVIYETDIAGEPPTLDFETPVDGPVHFAPTFNGQVSGFDTDAPGAAASYTYTLEFRTNGTGSNPARHWSATRRRFLALLFKR